MHNKDLSEFLLQLSASAANNSPKEHSRSMIALLRDVVKFESAWWGWSNFSATQAMFVNSETAYLPANFEDAFHKVARFDPFIHHGRDLRVYAMSVTKRNTSLPSEFRQFLDTFGIGSALNGHCQLQGNSDFNFFMSLYRREDEPAFTEEETNDFRMILRHLEQTLSLCLRAELRTAALDGGEVALLSARCGMVRATRGFIGRLDEERLVGGERDRVLRRLSEKERVWDGEHLRLTSQRYDTSLMLIHASPSSFRDILSPKERRVAEMLITGLTMREIADTRQVALNTVRNQVTAIYQKMGVSSKLGLAQIMNNHK
ncbi:MAG: LuxR C-terminal-related transcriptional regulator [Paracoccaceae bacterium]